MEDGVQNETPPGDYTDVSVSPKTRRTLKILVMIGCMSFGVCIVGAAMAVSSMKMKGQYQIVGLALTVLGIITLSACLIWCFINRKDISVIKQGSVTGWPGFDEEFSVTTVSGTARYSTHANSVDFSCFPPPYADNMDRNAMPVYSCRCPSYDTSVANIPPAYAHAVQMQSSANS